jgi:hypothetical protein
MRKTCEFKELSALISLIDLKRKTIIIKLNVLLISDTIYFVLSKNCFFFNKYATTLLYIFDWNKKKRYYFSFDWINSEIFNYIWYLILKSTKLILKLCYFSCFLQLFSYFSFFTDPVYSLLSSALGLRFQMLYVRADANETQAKYGTIR